MEFKHLLVIRFSAMGDVALTTPVIHHFLDKNPQYKITFVTKSFFTPLLFEHERLEVVGIHLDDYKGVFGLKKLAQELFKKDCDLVLDLHDVLRTKMLTFFLKLKGLKKYKINKERSLKKKLTKKPPKQLRQLKHTTQRYADVFSNLEKNYNFTFKPINQAPKDFTYFLGEENKKLIGIAPFAMHETKVWGMEKTELLIQQLIEKEKKIVLFGGGEKEKKQFENWKQKFPKIALATDLNFNNQINLISQLDLMISMDSSNMHIASILGVKTISVWGSTHHYLGFSPLGNEQNIIEISQAELNCRPCSAYGKTPCWRGDHACMQQITVKRIIEKINEMPIMGSNY